MVFFRNAINRYSIIKVVRFDENIANKNTIVKINC